MISIMVDACSSSSSLLLSGVSLAVVTFGCQSAAEKRTPPGAWHGRPLLQLLGCCHQAVAIRLLPSGSNLCMLVRTDCCSSSGLSTSVICYFLDNLPWSILARAIQI